MTSFFGAPNDQAVAAAIVVHAIAFMPVVLLGLLFMAQDGLSFGRLQGAAGTASEQKQEVREKQEVTDSDEVPVLRSSRR